MPISTPESTSPHGVRLPSGESPQPEWSKSYSGAVILSALVHISIASIGPELLENRIITPKLTLVFHFLIISFWVPNRLCRLPIGPSNTLIKALYSHTRQAVNWM
jgi:hypothetical protein